MATLSDYRTSFINKAQQKIALKAGEIYDKRQKSDGLTEEVFAIEELNAGATILTNGLDILTDNQQWAIMHYLDRKYELTLLSVKNYNKLISETTVQIPGKLAVGATGPAGEDAYVYIAYADDDSGTGFTNTFNTSKDYIAILTTTTEILSPAAGDFAGLWKNYKGGDGADGATGADGADGTRGSIWTSGAGAPSVTGGELENDKYLNDSNGDIYNFNGTSWVLVDNITGPTGATGSTGPAGEDAYVYIAYADDDAGTGFTNTFDAAKKYIAVLTTTTEIPSPAAGDFAGLWAKYVGEDGSDFTIDAIGSIADRSTYDGEAADFSFLDEDNGVLYIKLSAIAGDWSGPLPFIGWRGWSTAHTITTDGERRVLTLSDYVGGQGTKPTDHIGEHVGSGAYETDPADAIDIRGPMGKVGFPDAQDTLANRTTYDGEAKDFVFYATDDGLAYIKLSDTSADWSAGFRWKGDPGPQGPVGPASGGYFLECLVATTADLSATYAGGGKTLTATSNGALSVDGESPGIGDRILVKDQSTPAENWIYVVDDPGDASNPFVLVRASDADTSSELNKFVAVFVRSGSTNGDKTFGLAEQRGSLVLDTNGLTFFNVFSPIVNPGSGITIDALSNIKLGGTLTENADIALNGNRFRVQETSGPDTVTFLVDAIGTASINMSASNGVNTASIDLDDAQAYIDLDLNGVNLSISMSEVGFVLTNEIEEGAGVEYAADYSAGFTARSLVDKAYVDSVSGNGIYGGSDTLGGNTDVTLGGNILKFTNGLLLEFIIDDTSDFIRSLVQNGSGDNGQIQVNGDNVTISSVNGLSGDQVTIKLQASSGQFSITDSRSTATGIQYAADYSANYTNRSLVDKEYVDGSIDIPTAYSNGSDAIINLTAGIGGMIIRDAATPIGADLFAVQDNAGTTDYLKVDTNGLEVLPDTDATTTLGRASIGSPDSDIAYFAHIDHINTTNYALKQLSNASVVLNGGTSTNIAISNAIRFTLSTNKLESKLPHQFRSYTVAGVPAASVGEGALIYVTDENDGAIPVFSDGTDWRKIQDRFPIDVPSKTQVTGQFDKTTDTTLATVTGLEVTLEASKSYRFYAQVFFDCDATGGTKYDLSGTATASNIIAHALEWDDPNNLASIVFRITSLGSSVGDATAGKTSGLMLLRGVITTSGAGTFGVRFAQNASNNTSSVLVGSSLVAEEIA